MLRSASSGRPRLSLSASGTRGALGQFLPPGLRWHVSLSHDAGLVIAMVHLEQPGA
jgi:phosphopantetheinyl transferase (holo-ACP synthase)